MNRRELIQKTSLALGYSLSAPTLLGLLSGCELKHQAGFAPSFFSSEQAAVISDMAETILPRTKTPGAKDAGVPAFIDHFIKEVYNKVDQENFIKALIDFNNNPIEKYFRTFGECTPDVQQNIMHTEHSHAIAGAQGNSEGWWNSGNGAERPFILRVKELTILGFFTSEAGATQVLQYNVAPGPYRGCVPLNEVGKAWAT